jgi:hypothetical protein
MGDPAAMARDLRAHLALCEELLLLVERENQLLRTAGASPNFEFFQRRKALLPRLDASVTTLTKHRLAWQRLRPEARRHSPEISSLIRLNQDLIMKIIMLDRENEQVLLRRGLVPAQQVPLAGRPQPHFVAELYRRHSQR